MQTILNRSRLAGVLAALTAAAIGLSACSSGAAGGSGTIALVAFSVPKPAYGALEAAFQKTAQGKGVSFSESYGPSGTQATAVSNGQHADYVALSLEPDMAKLVPSYVAPNWDANRTHGIVSSSVAVICVRPGNPKHITGWDDLAKPGVKIVTPDPASSGSAKWNILAAYTHVLLDGGTKAQAEQYLTAFFRNVVSKPASGADAMQTFLSGTGDVLISYENEAITARQQNSKLDYIVPNESILIQNPAAVTKTASPQAKDFLSFAESTKGQKIFARNGFRPVDSHVRPGTVAGANDPHHPYPAVPKLETIAELGGWDKVDTEFFDPDHGIVSKIEAASG